MAETRLRFTILNSPLQGRQVEMPADRPVTIGRTSDNAVVLEHKSVSRSHARLEPNGAEFRLVDLDSHNGTLVGDHPVDGESPVEPGDLLTFGEVKVRFTVVAPEAPSPADQAAPTSPMALPALASDQPLAAAAERPLSFEDVFAQAEGAEAAAAPARARPLSPLAFAIVVVILLVVGGYAIWRVGRSPPEPPTIGLQLKAGEVLPVNLGGYLYRVARIEEPENSRVAYAKEASFRGFITVLGLMVGDTDIVVHGSPTGKVVLRVLVRGREPEPAWKSWFNEPPKVRSERARELMLWADAHTPTSGAVNPHTSKAIRNYEIAERLLANILGQEQRAAEAARKARTLRKARENRFNLLVKLTETRRGEANYKAAEDHAQELLRLFQGDPESVEYLVVQCFYEGLLDEKREHERTARGAR